jgi:hypothetical protein
MHLLIALAFIAIMASSCSRLSTIMNPYDLYEPSGKLGNQPDSVTELRGEDGNTAKETPAETAAKPDTTTTTVAGVAKPEITVDKDKAPTTHSENQLGSPVVAKFPKSATFYNRRNVSASNPNDEKSAKLYLDAGITLSDRICTLWFKKLGEAQATYSANRDIVSNIGALSATVMGLASAPSLAVGGTAAGFGFLENTMDSEVANFIVAPSIAKVEKVVLLNRASYAKDLKSQTISNFYEAEDAIISYDNYCSHNAIKRIVDESVTRASDAISDQQEKKKFRATIIDRTLAEVEKQLPATVQLAQQDVVALYALYFRSFDLPKSIVGEFSTQLKEKGIIDSSGKIVLGSNGNLAKVRQILLRLGQVSDIDRELDEKFINRSPAINSNGGNDKKEPQGSDASPESKEENTDQGKTVSPAESTTGTSSPDK